MVVCAVRHISLSEHRLDLVNYDMDRSFHNVVSFRLLESYGSPRMMCRIESFRQMYTFPQFHPTAVSGTMPPNAAPIPDMHWILWEFLNSLAWVVQWHWHSDRVGLTPFQSAVSSTESHLDHAIVPLDRTDGRVAALYTIEEHMHLPSQLVVIHPLDDDGQMKTKCAVDALKRKRVAPDTVCLDGRR